MTGGARFGILPPPPGTSFLSLLGGRLFLLGETCTPIPPLLRTLDVGLNIAKT